MLGDWGVKRGLPGSSGARLPTHPPNTNCSICNRCPRRPKRPLTDPYLFRWVFYDGLVGAAKIPTAVLIPIFISTRRERMMSNV